MRDLLIAALRFLHLLVLLFTLLAWILPFAWAWLVHLFLVPAMIVQWLFNDGTCLLTNLENAILGKKTEKSAQQGQFIKSLLGRCCNPLPSDAAIKAGLYGLLLLVWSVSLWRFLSQ